MKTTILLLLLASTLSLPGCGSGDADSPPPEATGSPLPDTLFLDREPDGARPLRAVKESARPGDEVTFRARIGGREKPFADDRAVMVVIDPSLPSCADVEGDSCPVPWDYCCETPESLVANTATVQLVDADGEPLAASLEGRDGLDKLAWITVVGTVQNKDDTGLFVVNASGLFVDRDKG